MGSVVAFWGSYSVFVTTLADSLIISFFPDFDEKGI